MLRTNGVIKNLSETDQITLSVFDDTPMTHITKPEPKKAEKAVKVQAAEQEEEAEQLSFF